MFNIESIWQWMVLLALLVASVVRLAFHFFPSMTKRRRGTSPPPAGRCGGCCGCERGQD